MRSGEDVQFGVTSSASPSSPTVTRTSPTRLQATLTPISVSAQLATTCAIRPDGTLWCWGRNTSGNVGDGTSGNVRPSPQRVGSSPHWSAVSAGAESTCAIDSDGALWCWGLNSVGQVGRGDRVDSSVPVLVDGPRHGTPLKQTWIEVAVGEDFACGRTADRSLYCWGNLTPGGTASSLALVPTYVDGGFVSLSAGFHHACGMRSDRSLWCFGSNSHGQLGIGSNASSGWVPQPVAPGKTWLSASAAWVNTCAVDSADVAFCWGSNDFGQIGDGTTITRLSPTPVGGGMLARTIAPGGVTTCAIDAAGALRCWGQNANGELADPAFGFGSSVPIAPSWAAFPLVGITAGGFHGCAIDQSAGFWCWGVNTSGQVGAGAVSAQSGLVRVF